MNKKLIGIFAFLVLVLAMGFVNSETSYCCEKTIDGAWCQNDVVSQCNANYRKAATSCEATSYCKLGTCVDTEEGLCQENTPQRVCENNNGVWYDESADELAQCQLGCCLLGNQAAFVTQTRCKALSSLYGLETSFKTNVENEFACIASATSEEKGACVIEKDNERTCKMLTQRECQALESSGYSSDSGGGLFSDLFGGNEEETTGGTDISFHKGYLCSADVLATDCGPRGGTTCVEGEDAVYYKDTCENIANIYDYSKRNNQDYWTYIKEPDESCGYGQSNANSRTCGNCDYYSGSTCKSYRETDSPTALYGDYVCADLSCTYEGETYEHGEAWCVTNTKKGEEESLPGSESFRLLCYNGEVTVEPCDSFRATVCVEEEVNGFSNAICRANIWQDCVEQDNEEDCLNTEERDCEWIEGYSILRDDDGKEMKLENADGKDVKASCVPLYAPGFDFWKEETDAAEICPAATYYCIVEYEYRTISFDTKEEIEAKRSKKYQHCVKNCKCIPGWEPDKGDKCESGCESHEEFLESVQSICGSLGDCGVSVNYIGKMGNKDEYAVEFSDIE